MIKYLYLFPANKSGRRMGCVSPNRMNLYFRTEEKSGGIIFGSLNSCSEADTERRHWQIVCWPEQPSSIWLISSLYLSADRREQIFIKTLIVLQTEPEFRQPEDTKVVIKCQQQKLSCPSYDWIEVYYQRPSERFICFWREPGRDIIIWPTNPSVPRLGLFLDLEDIFDIYR